MAAELLNYTLADGVATITLDDGKRNALSPEMFRQIYAALDRAEADKAMVIFTGREDVFSAGFDLKVMKKGGAQTIAMLKAGYSLTARVLSYPYPTLTACNGHVLAMGVFLMLSCDYVVGTEGDFKISANEVAIGLTLPRVAELMLRHRLRPADFQRAGILAEYFPVAQAYQAGFFDELAAPGQCLERARAKAREFATLDIEAHTATKRRVRRQLLRDIRRNVPLDLKDAVAFGIRSAVKARKAKAA